MGELVINMAVVTADGNSVTKTYSKITSKEFFQNAKENNYIIILDANDEEVQVFGASIIDRQTRFIKRIAEIYDTLSDKHKLILHLPEIMVKLGWLHGALCQIHWLEGSKATLKFPYEFFMSEERVKNIDKIKLEEYFRNIQYLSLEDLGYVAGNASNPDGENYFLYNERQLDSVKDSLELFHKNLIEVAADRIVGGNEIFKKNINDEDTLPNENFFQSFPLGSEEGDLDDIGAALGRYDLRCYYQGYVHKDSQKNQCFLYTNSVKCRFFDVFCFEDSFQLLGRWKFDTENPCKPKKLMPGKKWYTLTNKTYRNLKNILVQYVNSVCNDFYIYSPFKIIDDEFLAKIIRIY